MSTDNYLTTQYVDRWHDLLEFTERWYGWVDRRAFAAVIAAALNHYWLDEPPIWLLLQRPPEYAFLPFLAYHDAVHSRDFVPRLLENLLAQSKPHAIWVFPEMEKLYASRPYIQKQFTRCLSSIRHGEVWINRHTFWSGKVTVLAATSVPVKAVLVRKASRCWAPLSGTFLVVRWKRQDEEIELEFAQKRVGNEQQIVEGIRSRVNSLMDLNFRRPYHADLIHDGLRDLVKIATLATHCQRAIEFRSEVWVESLVRLCRAHATLMGKLKTDQEEAYIAKRLGMDALSPWVLKILKAFPGGRHLTFDNIQDETAIPKRSLQELLKLLQIKGAIYKDKINFEDTRRQVYKRETYYSLADGLDNLLTGDL